LFPARRTALAIATLRDLLDRVAAVSLYADYLQLGVQMQRSSIRRWSTILSLLIGCQVGVTVFHLYLS